MCDKVMVEGKIIGYTPDYQGRIFQPSGNYEPVIIDRFDIISVVDPDNYVVLVKIDKYEYKKAETQMQKTWLI